MIFFGKSENEGLQQMSHIYTPLDNPDTKHNLSAKQKRGIYIYYLEQYIEGNIVKEPFEESIERFRKQISKIKEMGYEEYTPRMS